MASTDNPELRRKSFYDHPKLAQLLSSGIESKEVREQALLVYLHLIEVQFWFDVDMLPVPSQQLVFLKGRRTSESEDFEYVLPQSSNSTFTMECVRDLINFAASCGCTANALVLAFVDTSAMVIYHKVSNGLVPPKKLSNREILKMNRVTEWNHKKGTWRTYTKNT